MPNTLKQNVDRVKAAKTAIGNAIIAKGGTVSVGDGLEEFAAAIGTIPSGDDSGYFIKESLPISFKGDGNNLTDYTIYGKQGGLIGVCPNVYPPIDDNSIHRNYWGEWYKSERYLPDEPAYNRSGAWQGLCNEIFLDVGTYTLSVYIKTEDVTITDGVSLYIVEYRDFPKYSQAATVTLPGTTTPTVGPTLKTVTNSWQRYTFTFDITTAGYVAPRVEKRNDDGTNIIVTCYQLEKGVAASPYVAYNTTGITITANGSNIFFPLDEPLGPDDTLTMADTGVSIATIDGPNVISTPIVGGFDMKIKGGVSTDSVDDHYVSRIIDFGSNGSLLMGDPSTHSVYAGMGRCNVADDGTINAYYGDDGYTEDGSNGQVMVKIPKFYYKFTPITLSGANIRAGWWHISDVPSEGYKLHPAFLAADGVTELPYFLYGAFEGVGQNSNGAYSSDYNTSEYKLSSIGGNTYKPIRSLTRATARTMATNRGAGWYQIGVKQTMAIQMLFGVEYGFNSQLAVGYGVASDADLHNTGQTVGNTTSGTRNNKTTCVNYHGIENMWGNLWSWSDGINFNNRIPYICNTFSFVDDTTTGYTQLAFNIPVSNYITAFGYDANNDWVILQSETSPIENADGPIGDSCSSDIDFRICQIGGRWTNDTALGICIMNCVHNSSIEDQYIGARIMYIPTTATE